jgi:hypothetical protein
MDQINQCEKEYTRTTEKLQPIYDEFDQLHPSNSFIDADAYQPCLQIKAKPYSWFVCKSEKGIQQMTTQEYVCYFQQLSIVRLLDQLTLRETKLLVSTWDINKMDANDIWTQHLMRHLIFFKCKLNDYIADLRENMVAKAVDIT